MDKPVLFVVAAGPGVSGSVARRFGREGYDAALVGLDETVLEELAASLRDDGIQARWRKADITDAEEFAAAASDLGESVGRIDVLHFNPSAFRHKTPLELTPEELAADVHVGVGALLTAVQSARPFMRAGGRITATGSMAADKPWNEAASLGVQKAGPAQPGPQHRHHPEAGGDPGGLRDGPRHARQGRSVHAGPRGRGDLRRGCAGRGELANRGPIHGLAAVTPRHAREYLCWMKIGWHLVGIGAVLALALTACGRLGGRIRRPELDHLVHLRQRHHHRPGDQDVREGQPRHQRQAVPRPHGRPERTDRR